MGQRFLLDVAPTGVQHSVEIEDGGDSIVMIEHTPTLVEEHILDENARARSLAHSGGNRNFQLAARIPILTYNMWKAEWRRDYADKMPWPQFEVMKLNSRDNHKLRVGHKRSAFGKKL